MDNELTIRDLSPSEVVVNATNQARLLMDIVNKTKCYQEISGKKYLQVEAWETIGAFNRTHADTDMITPIMRGDDIVGYQAYVALYKDGDRVGGAIMPCYFTENCCKGKEGDAKHKACMSAAQTFATSKAYRMNFSYVAILAGYQPIPAEEITSDMVITEVDKTKHWCKLHETQFFMKGKMKSYAHPIGDTSEWCHERTKSIEKRTTEIDTEQAEQDSQDYFPPKNVPPSEVPEAEVKQDGIIIDMNWLKESLEKLNWADVGKWMTDKYKVTGKGVRSMVGALTKEQQGEFVKEVESRLELL